MIAFQKHMSSSGDWEGEENVRGEYNHDVMNKRTGELDEGRDFTGTSNISCEDYRTLARGIPVISSTLR